jgi:hypothetical protein
MSFDAAKMGPVFKFVDNQFVAAERLGRACSFLIQGVYGRGSWNREKSPGRSKQAKNAKNAQSAIFYNFKVVLLRNCLTLRSTYDSL